MNSAINDEEEEDYRLIMEEMGIVYIKKVNNQVFGSEKSKNTKSKLG